MQQFISQIDKRGGETMATFRKNNIRELKKLLYNSDVHDAKLENFGYKCCIISQPDMATDKDFKRFEITSTAISPATSDDVQPSPQVGFV